MPKLFQFAFDVAVRSLESHGLGFLGNEAGQNLTPRHSVYKAQEGVVIKYPWVQCPLGPVPSRPRLTQASPCWWGRNHCAAFCERPWAHSAVQERRFICRRKASMICFFSISMFFLFRVPVLTAWRAASSASRAAMAPRWASVYVIPCRHLTGSLRKMHLWTLILSRLSTVPRLPYLSTCYMDYMASSANGLYSRPQCGVMDLYIELKTMLWWKPNFRQKLPCRCVDLHPFFCRMLITATACAQVASILAKCSLAWQCCCLWEIIPLPYIQ